MAGVKRRRQTTIHSPSFGFWNSAWSLRQISADGLQSFSRQWLTCRSLRPIWGARQSAEFRQSKEEMKNRYLPRHRKKLAGIPFVCECLHCMATMTKEATVSVRLTAREKSGLDADARMKGIPSGTAAAATLPKACGAAGFRRLNFGTASRAGWPIWWAAGGRSG